MQSRIDRLNQNWNNVKESSKAVRDRLERAEQEWEKLTDTLAQLNSWVEEKSAQVWMKSIKIMTMKKEFLDNRSTAHWWKSFSCHATEQLDQTDAKVCSKPFLRDFFSWKIQIFSETWKPNHPWWRRQSQRLIPTWCNTIWDQKCIDLLFWMRMNKKVDLFNVFFSLY